MSRRSAFVFALVLAFVLPTSCRYEPSPAEATRRRIIQRTVWQRSDMSGKNVNQKFVLQPKVLQRCEAGTRLGEDGLVAQPATVVRPDEPVYLSMWLAEAPEGLQVALRVVDRDENEIGTARRDDVGGVRAVTLHVGEELEPGKYRLEGFWGGNLVCEKSVEVQ